MTTILKVTIEHNEKITPSSLEELTQDNLNEFLEMYGEYEGIVTKVTVEPQ
jgi:hypothetical protein